MPDRDKVILALKIHAEGCGYRSHHCDTMECPYRYGDESCDIEEMCRDALEVLKEQKEKIGEWIYKHDDLWYCSRCGEIIYSSTDDDLEIHHAYCSRCGAKMKQEGR